MTRVPVICMFIMLSRLSVNTCVIGLGNDIKVEQSHSLENGSVIDLPPAKKGGAQPS